MKIAVIIPAYNEEKTIQNIIQRIPKYENLTTIIIDDGSTDQTKLLAQQTGTTVISHHQNQGVGTAFQTGLQHCLENNYDTLITLDADNQMYPEDIPWILYPLLKKNADVVTATRFQLKHLNQKMSPIKKIGNKIFTKIINTLTGLKLTDTQCGYRAYNRKAMKHLTLYGKFTYTQETLINLSAKNLNIQEIPLHIKPKRNGQSKVVTTIPSYTIKALKIIYNTYQEQHPEKLFGIPALIFFITGIGIITTKLILKYQYNIGIAEHPWIFLAGITLTTISLILTLITIITVTLSKQKKILEQIKYNQW